MSADASLCCACWFERGWYVGSVLGVVVTGSQGEQRNLVAALYRRLQGLPEGI